MPRELRTAGLVAVVPTRRRALSNAGRRQSDYTDAMFHPVVEAWFRARFTEPTPVQAGAWPLIAAGRDVLLTAPTGSGKTLAAFLACLDRLFREACEGRLEDRTDDPLRLAAQGALQRRAAEPGRAPRRAGRGGARRRGFPRRRSAPRSAPATRPRTSGGRCGQPAAAHPGDHARVALHPAHRRVEPALARRRAHRHRRRDSRGGGRQARRAPGALPRAAGRRWCARAGRSACSGSASRPPCGRSRPRRGSWSARRGRCPRSSTWASAATWTSPSRCSRDELGAVCTNEQWEEIYDRVAELARAHRSTLVFVNTRRLVERVDPPPGRAPRRGARWPRTTAASAGARRFDAEQRLKAGELCAGGRDRLARARHRRGHGGSHLPARLAALHRHRAPARRPLGPRPRRHAQGPALPAHPRPARRVRGARARGPARRSSTGSACATRRSTSSPSRSWRSARARSRTRTRSSTSVRRAAPYATLAREDFDAVVDMLSEGVATRRGRARRAAPPRRGGAAAAGRGAARGWPRSPRAAPSPTTPNYEVVLEPDETHDRHARRGLRHRVDGGRRLPARQHLVAHPPGRERQGARRGRAAARRRPSRSGSARGRRARASCRPRWRAVREERGRAPATTPRAAAALARSTRPALDRRGALLARDYVAAAQRGARRGAHPDDGGRRAVLRRGRRHAARDPRAVRRPHQPRLGPGAAQALLPQLRLRAAGRRHRRRRAALARAAAQLPARGGVRDAAPGRRSRSCSIQAALQAPMFRRAGAGTRRRSLALLRWQSGRKVPPPSQRMRADDLLAAVFPDAARLPGQRGAGAHRGRRITRSCGETMRDCLTEAMDIEGLRAVLARARTPGRSGA